MAKKSAGAARVENWLESRIENNLSISKVNGKFSEHDLRATYTLYRDRAQKQLKRLEKSEFSSNNTYKRYSEGFKKLSEIDNTEDLGKALISVVRFTHNKNARVGDLKKLRSKQMKKFKEMGFKNVTKENYNAFAEFMGEWKAKYSGAADFSEFVADWFWTQTDNVKKDGQKLWGEFEKWWAKKG